MVLMQLIGVSAVISEAFIEQLMNTLSQQKNSISPKVRVMTPRHLGRFGKANAALFDFIATFIEETGIPLDRVYTGKMMAYLSEQIAQGVFQRETHIVSIHTGGLQGNRTNSK